METAQLRQRLLLLLELPALRTLFASISRIDVTHAQCLTILHRLDQRMLQVVAGMVFQADEFRTKPLQAERSAANGRIVGMRQHAAVDPCPVFNNNPASP